MDTCPGCGSPQVGNETFCSNCGMRVLGASRVVRLANGRARRQRYVLLLLGALFGAAVVFGLIRASAPGDRTARGRARAAEPASGLSAPAERNAPVRSNAPASSKSPSPDGKTVPNH